MGEIKKGSRMTARQQLINNLIDSARNEVIYCEMERDFYKHLDEKIKKGDIDESVFASAYAGNVDLQQIINQNDARYQFSLTRLNFFKDLRKQDQDKNAVKAAQKLRHMIPNEIKVDLVKEK